MEIYTDRYEREHGHKPQGRRFWRFTLVSSSITAKDHFLDLSEQMTYPKALEKAQEVARLRKFQDHRRAVRRPAFSSEKWGYQSLFALVQPGQPIRAVQGSIDADPAVGAAVGAPGDLAEPNAVTWFCDPPKNPCFRIVMQHLLAAGGAGLL